MKQIAVCVIVFAAMSTVTATNPDEILSLPGLLKQPSFPHYSGYLNGTGTIQLHYWLVTSADKITNPLIIFLYGGPGCSSLFSLFAENGPFMVRSDGVNLDYNEFSWNSYANVLYIESPAGVGFSYSEDQKYVTDDDQITEHHYAAVKSFYNKYPKMISSPIYLMGESYASVYVSLLALKFITKAEGFQNVLQGIATGNGLNSVQKNVDSIVPYVYYHGIIGNDMWTTLQDQCCHGDECSYFNSTNANCTDSVNDVYNLVTDSGLNMYNLYANCEGSNKYSWDKKNKNVQVDLPCVNTTAITKYLRDPYVRQALHVDSSVPAWQVCNQQVGQHYHEQYSDLTDIYKKLLALYQYRILFYNGDVDLTCNALGNEWFVKDLGRGVSVQWRAWLYNDGADQIAGFIQEYDDHLAFVTIKGAGHMAPKDKPNATHQLIYNFIYNRPY